MPNKLPKANKITSAALEDQLTPVILSGSDPDGTITGYTLASLPTNGTLYLDAAGVVPAVVGVNYNSNTFYFLPNANFNGKSSFNFLVTDNQNGISASAATVTFDVAAVNDAPVVDMNGSASGNSVTLAYKANDPPLIIAPSALVTDIDSANFGGGSISVSITQNGTASDQLSITTDSIVSLTAQGNVLVNGIKIGTLAANGSNGSDLLIGL